MAIASNINAATNASSVVKGEGREAVIDELQGSVADLLDLTDDVDIPEVSLPQEGGVQGSFTEPEELTPYQIAENIAAQKDMEAETSLADRFGTNTSNMQDSDVINIWGGGESSQKMIDGLLVLGGTDSVQIPFDEAKAALAMKPFTEGEPTEIDPTKIETTNFVDKNKTIPLTSAELFIHMDAVQLTADSRTLEVSPDLQILSLAMVEAHMSSNLEQESIIPQEMVDKLGAKEVSDLTGMDESQLESGTSDQTLGRVIHEEWTKLKQRNREGLDAELNDHLNPDYQLTKDAYEQLGLWGKQSFAVARPDLVMPVKVPTRSGGTRLDYLPTAVGAQVFADSMVDLMPPKIFQRPQLDTNNPSATANNGQTKDTTGFNMRDTSEGAFIAENEARFNLASVKHVISQVRLKVGMLMSLAAIGESSDVKLVGSTINQAGIAVGGKLKVKTQVGNMLGIGQKAADKINNASANAILQIETLNLTLAEMYSSDPRRTSTEDKINILTKFAIEAATDTWKMKAYRQRSSMALQMLQDIAQFKDDPISFTNYLQLGTSRIGYSAQKMNMQNHKLARQMYGSGTKYQIVPGSNSNAEYAMLVTIGTHFFSEGNTVPEKTYMNMRDRINKNDSKVLRIAAAGRKLKAVIGNYNVESTTDAVLSMDMVENRVSGVQGVLETLGDLRFDDDIKSFFKEVFKHPDEVINLVEEAIELGNYMDSVKSKIPFDSMMRPIEVDGISNGIASMSTHLGMKDAMYRIGVLRQNPDKVLAEFDGVEGNIRAVLARNMKRDLNAMLYSSKFQEKYRVGPADKEEVMAILELAIANDKIFLKKPIMTLPYGQAVSSMLYIALETITSSPSLLEKATENDLGTAGVAKLLHGILAHSLESTLGADVIEFSEALKDATSVAMAANQPIVFRKPTMTRTTVNGVDIVQTGRDPVISQINEEWTDEAGKRRRNPIKNMRAEYPSTRKEMVAIGGENIKGSSIATAILPQVIISIDGSTMALALSGDRWKDMQAATKQQVPYVTAIYDAVIGDLGSFRSLVANMNKTWIETCLNYDLLNEMVKGIEGSKSKGLRKLTTLAQANPNMQNFDLNKQVGQMLSLVDEADGSPAWESILNRMSDSEKELLAIANVSNESMLSGYSDGLTNKQALDLYNLVSPLMDVKIKRLKRAAVKAKKAREILKKEIGNNPVFQFNVDDIGDFAY